MQQRYTSTLPNLTDGNVGSIGWSGGNQVLQTAGLKPSIGERYEVLGWSLVLDGFLVSYRPTRNTYGQLGSIYAGLQFGPQQPGVSGRPLGFFDSLPTELSMVEKVYDGLSDRPFSFAAGIPSNTPLSHNASIGAPLTFFPPDALTFGVWLSPGLVEGTVMQLENLRYTILYDDGYPVPPGPA